MSQQRRRSVTATEQELIEAEALPPEQRIALAYTPAVLRARLAAFFAFDQRLARIVGKAGEPTLAQMRLAWWREMLAKPAGERPNGDAVLDAIGVHWSGYEEALIVPVDGWEELLVSQTVMMGEAKRFCAKRAFPLLHLAGKFGHGYGQRTHAAGSRWAAADTAVNVSNEMEREAFVATGLARAPGSGTIPKALRGVAVLEALAMRSLKHGGRPLMEGRGAALTAFRAGLLGR